MTHLPALRRIQGEGLWCSNLCQFGAQQGTPSPTSYTKVGTRGAMAWGGAPFLLGKSHFVIKTPTAEWFPAKPL